MPGIPETGGTRFASHDLDRGLVAATIMLALGGLLLIYSADNAQNSFVHFQKQGFFLAAGLVLMSLLAVVPSRYYYAFAYAIFVLSIVMLVLVLVSGTSGFGAKRWLSIAGTNVQPSEPAKIALVFALARVLSYRTEQQTPYIRLILTVAALTAIPTLLILVQPDLGTATVFPVIAVAMLAWFGLPARFFIFSLLPFLSLFLTVKWWAVLPFIIAGFVFLWREGTRWVGTTALILVCLAATWSAPVVWNQLEPYQQRRLTNFLNPASDPLGSGYQVIQSKVAIGSGGVTGNGFLQGTQTQLRFLPQQHTDFIFALAGEEFGFMGAMGILALFMAIIWRGFSLASLTKNSFMSLAAAGITAMILYHSLVNMGMVIGVLPVTGLPLPFLSYGGSFLLNCLAACGVLISAGLHRRER